MRSATGFLTRVAISPVVSIHALLAECDPNPQGRGQRPMSFNPRTPCGVRLPGNNHQGQTARFQSTHSLRSATSYQLMRNGGGNVSIHALLAECDPICRLFAQPTVKFQSTHSLRSATVQGCYMPYRFRVSIHALLAECDIRTMHGQTLATGFNPRTPCGVRR